MHREQKDRLEQELRFLKESLEADVISKDEYEKGKERIERKLKEIEQKTEEKIEEAEQPKEKIEIKEIHEGPKIIKKEKPEEKQEIKEEISQEEKEIKEKITEEEKPAEEPKKEPEIEERQEEAKEEKAVEEPAEEPKKEAVEEKKEKIGEEKEKEEKEEPEDEIQISKKWLYVAIILVIAVILIFSIRSCSKSVEEKTIEEFIPECSSDSDCKQKGMVGTCINPGEKEAKCEFKEDAKVELMVINDEDCKLCSTSRMKNVIKEIFPNLEIRNLDYKTAETEDLVIKSDINALPAYILDSNVAQAMNFNDFKSALIKKDDSYLINNKASGANYYFKREKIDNKLDVFLTADIEEKIDNNLNEFLDLFGDNINFTKHLVTQKQKTKLSEELGITSYPAFLINNQIKFGGFQSANSIKEKFCQLNKLDGCKVELSKI